MRAGLLLAAAFAFPASALAQPADLPVPAASGEPLPPGVSIGTIGGKSYYLDGKGRVLYGMDMRVLLRDGPDPALHCQGECAKTWEPLLAAGKAPNIAYPRGFGVLAREERPAGFITQPQTAPDWTVIAGAQGPQWVYKGWHMVFARVRDGRSDRFDGEEERTWNTLKYLPPKPKLVAPADVQAVVADGGYVLADGKGRRLYTGTCTADCADWLPYRAGIASAGVGAWTVSRDGDVAQWLIGGRAVFIAPEDAPGTIPAGAKELRP